MNERTELKPCPFCGGEASLRDEPYRYYKYTVYCTKCGIGTLAEHIESIAIHAWNRRADDETLLHFASLHGE